MDGCCTISFGGTDLLLTGERAIWREDRRTLFVADLHLGKPASVRQRGAPVPEDVTRRDLDRLGGLLDRFGAELLVVLGDLAHDRVAWQPVTLDAFSAWRASRPGLAITLVRGNHDRWAADPPAELAIEVIEPGGVVGGLALHHEPPEENTGVPALCGHLHPGVRLIAAGPSRKGRPGLRAPCYWFSERLGVLPAFGTFTGCAMIRPHVGDRVYAVGTGRVMEVTGACAV